MKNMTGKAENTIEEGWPSMAENHWFLEYTGEAASK